MTLNRFGALRLLSVISKKCPDFILTGHSLKDTQTTNTTATAAPTQRTYVRGTHSGGDSNTQWNGRPRHQHRHYSHPHTASRTSDYQRSSHPNETNRNTNAIHRQPHKKSGCYNCGELNHHRSTCRYDHTIRCSACHQLGHKHKLCHLYNA